MLTPMRYDLKDISLPEGFTPQDADWMVISWDLRDETGSEPFLAQMVLTPGQLMYRYGEMNTGSYRKRDSSPPDDLEEIHSRTDTSSISRLAEMTTASLLGRGFQMIVKPYAFTIDPNKYPTWPKEYRSVDGTHYLPVETLGDLVEHTPTMVLRDVFNETFEHRKKQVKNRWTSGKSRR